ncbi:hypothetical protein BJ742DRAFT_788516 [Cladochytrium replicatum]|nr:hypothetical protein BJ742DRAFT_788516 [Cladochytrium replicatum]
MPEHQASIRWEKRTTSLLQQNAQLPGGRYKQTRWSLATRRKLNQCICILFAIATLHFLFGETLLDPFRRVRTPPRASNLPSVPKTKASICLISPWEGPVPDYTHLWAASVRRNDPSLLRVFFVHHRRNGAPVPKWATSPNLSTNDNLIYIDLENVNPRYAQGGFRTFFAERLCAFHKNLNPAWENSQLCADLRSDLEFTDLYLNDLRGYFGIVFANWVNPAVCDSWGWTDVDLVYGDLSKYFAPEKNKLAWSADVWTVGSGDLNRRYVHGQLTVHVFNPIRLDDPDEGPHAVGAKKAPDMPSLKAYDGFKHMNAFTSYPAFMHFRNCPKMATLRSLRDAYTLEDYKAWDEGCYSHGIITGKGVRVVDFTLQASDYKDAMVLNINRNVYVCNRPDTTQCLPLLSKAPFQAPNYSSRKNAKAIVPIERSSGNQDCMFWIGWEFAWCVKDMPSSWYPPRRQAVVVHFGDGTVEFRDYEGEREVRDDTVLANEYAVFHWQGWKKEMKPECAVDEWKANALANRKLERSWISWGEGRFLDLNHICSA